MMDDMVTKVLAMDPGHLLTPGEVGSVFRVDPKTVTRWAASGRIKAIRTPGGHRRFRAGDVQELLGRPTVAAITHGQGAGGRA
jgi:excisionase family DNA binding protein